MGEVLVANSRSNEVAAADAAAMVSEAAAEGGAEARNTGEAENGRARALDRSKRTKEEGREGGARDSVGGGRAFQLKGIAESSNPRSFLHLVLLFVRPDGHGISPCPSPPPARRMCSWLLAVREAGREGGRAGNWKMWDRVGAKPPSSPSRHLRFDPPKHAREAAAGHAPDRWSRRRGDGDGCSAKCFMAWLYVNRRPPMTSERSTNLSLRSTCRAFLIRNLRADKQEYVGRERRGEERERKVAQRA